jgi:hypothetical protein
MGTVRNWVICSGFSLLFSFKGFCSGPTVPAITSPLVPSTNVISGKGEQGADLCLCNAKQAKSAG